MVWEKRVSWGLDMGRFEWFTRGMFFKGIRVIAAFGVLLGVAGCSASSDLDELPKQEPLVSIMKTEDAFSGPAKAPTGWLFYAQQAPPKVIGPFLQSFQLSQGKIVGSHLEGSASADIIEAIEAVDFEPFDWKSEAVIAEARLKEDLIRQATLQGKDVAYMPPVTLDGAEYEIIINSKRGRFSMREWNPWPEIDYYAPYSEKIAKLKRVIDTLALHTGRKQLGIAW